MEIQSVLFVHYLKLGFQLRSTSGKKGTRNSCVILIKGHQNELELEKNDIRIKPT